MNKKYTVYKHTNKLNNKVYIGITSRKVEVRWGVDGCGYISSPHFMSAIIKYGWDNFEHDILFENLTKEELISKPEYRDTRVMTVQRSKVLRTRPRFDKWSITFRLRYDETKIDLETIAQAIEYAGSFVGLCDSRPKYGKFVAVIKELD